MRNTLEALYFGNIVPYEKQFDRTSEYGKALSTIADTQAKLLGMLTPEQQALLDQFTEAHSTVTQITGLEDFIQGIRLGAKLMLELTAPGSDGQFTDIKERK